jgi:hypothetical protein
LLLTLFPFALFAVGLGSREGSSHSSWQVISVIGGPFIFLSAVSAAGSLMLARRVENRNAVDAGEDVLEPNLGRHRTSELGRGAVQASAEPASPASFEKRGTK